MSGTLLEAHPALRVGRATSLTGERALAALLRHAKVPVCRFPSTAALRCCFQSNASAAERLRRRCRQPSCTRLNGLKFETRPGHSEVARGKYPTELRAAVAHALALKTRGGHYALVHSSDHPTAAEQLPPPPPPLMTRARRLRAAALGLVPSSSLLPMQHGARLVVATPASSQAS